MRWRSELRIMRSIYSLSYIFSAADVAATWVRTCWSLSDRRSPHLTLRIRKVSSARRPQVCPFPSCLLATLLHVIAQAMSTNQSKKSRRRRGRDLSHTPSDIASPATPTALGQAINVTNSNQNVNNHFGTGNIINNNPTINVFNAAVQQELVRLLARMGVMN